MTKKKKSILSDQRFIVLLVIIVLFAVFSFKSRERSEEHTSELQSR